MRKLTFLLACLLMVSIGLVNAQSKSISGKVLSADDGQPIIGATVKVKGSSTGVITNSDGVFRVTTSEGQILVISYVGMKSSEAPAKSGMVITLASDSKMMNEVVVTALGITREKKSLGYSVSDVKGDEMLKSRGGVSNPINSLAGKVSGLQITSGSGNMGGSSKILLRGVKSVSGNNQPLFIVDGVPIEGTDFNSTTTARGAGGYDYGNLIQDINPDDIESISVLKGANASALYGSRATNGVVMITTKKGTAKAKGFGVSFSTGLGIEKVNKLPVMQKEYGGGYGLYSNTIDGISTNTIDYDLDESWGPKYDGSLYTSWYDLAKWENGGKQPGTLTQSVWQAPKNDIDKFFETGVSYTNNISVSQASENSSVRLSYTNTTLKGYMPNSKQNKNSFNISASAKLNKVYEVFTNLTYLNQATTGRSATGYDDNNIMQKFIQWGQRQLDMVELKSLYKLDNGSQATWNRTAWDDATPAYSNNPYWSRYMNYQNDTRNRVYGNVGAKAYILPSLTAQFKSNLDFFSDKQFERNAVYSQEESYFGETHRQQSELNNEFMLMYNKTLNDISINANAGANSMYRKYERLTGYSVSGLVIPGFYNLSNSLSAPKSENYTSEKGIYSVFAGATLGYHSLAFLDLTYRNDWSSTLPKGNNSYGYYSATGSYLFSEMIKQDWLNLGKIRLSYAHTGGDTSPYNTNDYYSFYTSFNDNHAYQLPSVKNNPELKPEQTNSLEFGLEASMLNNRIGIDIAMYQSTTSDQIMPLSLSGATGYTSMYINGGTIQNRGFEVKVNFSPVKTKDFEWTVTATAAHNKNTVKELYGDVQYYRLASAPFKVEVGAKVGEEYGVIMGTDYLYDDKGNKIVGSNGLYSSTSGNVALGSVNPTITGGITNTFRYKNFDMSILFDGQAGGKFFSTSYMWGMYSGMLDETAGLNELGIAKRDDPATGGGVLLQGVLADGTVNTTRVDAETWASGYYSGPAAQNVFKSDFIKLREITIGYNVPVKSKIINSFKVSAYGRNLAIWGPDTKHFDPETATTNSGNVQGIEGGALPSVATYGLNLSFQF